MSIIVFPFILVSIPSLSAHPSVAKDAYHCLSPNTIDIYRKICLILKVIGPNPCEDFGGKNILVVEDIVDTGRTVTALSNMINEFSPASVAVAAMVVKRLPDVTYKPDFAGFSVPNEFVIGYGLDYNEYFREMNHICIMNQAGIDKFKM